MLGPAHTRRLKKVIQSHNGKPLDQAKLLKPNEMLAKVLIARFFHMTLEQQQNLRKILTPETAASLEVLLPEMKPIIKQGMSNAGQ